MPPRKLILLLALAMLAVSGTAGAGAHGRGARAMGRGSGHGGGVATGRGGHAGGVAKGRGGHAGGGVRAKGHGQGILAEPHPIPDVVVALPPGLPGAVTSIGAALKRLETITPRAGDYFVIYIKAGEYKEYLNITTKNVVFLGDGMDSTIITGSRSKKKGFNTEQSATLAVLADGFMARDIAIHNTAGDPVDEQAVALLVDSGNSVFFRCSIRGYQDSLFAKQHAQFYRECNIWGTVDFIFGDAAAVFQECSIFVRRSPPGKPDVVTAHGREFHNHSSGFIFQNCTVDVSPLPGESLTATGVTYLGRPWQSHARVVFMFSSISSIVHADGWMPWNGTSLAGGQAPLPGHEEHMYFASFRNHVLRSKEPVYWHNFTEINIAEARKYTPKRFLHADSWLRATGVTCYLGLEASTKVAT